MNIRRRYTLYFTYAIAGILLMLFSYFEIFPESVRYFTGGLGLGLLVIGLTKALRFHRIVKSDEAAREYEARQTEERSAFITMRATRVVFFCSVILQLIAAVVFQFLQYELISQVLCYLTVLQGVAYAVLWRVFDRKY